MWRQIQGWSGLFTLAAVAALALVWVLVRGADNALPQGPAADKHAVQAQGHKRTRDMAHITAGAAVATADGRQAVTVAFQIAKDWHLYANPVQDKNLKLPDYFSGVETTITASISGKPVAIQVAYPEGTLVQCKEYGGAFRVYEDGVRIQAVAQRVPGDTGPLEISVRCQACNDILHTCLPPETIKVTAP
ncbi:MAG TPA: protein-disulfide reductase DsbD domain-containing protein [Gemmataceae bacterium]|jgi:hypothetical protein|nr:protein-disulfide reductase DsbD domain-containing protein [Gemmataceae bacterium]